MDVVFYIVLIVIVIAVIWTELVRSTRVIIAYLRHDDRTVNRLTMSYSYCEHIAEKKYGCSKELFSKYWDAVKSEKNAVPYDALELAEWEWDVINNK